MVIHYFIDEGLKYPGTLRSLLVRQIYVARGMIATLCHCQRVPHKRDLSNTARTPPTTTTTTPDPLIPCLVVTKTKTKQNTLPVLKKKHKHIHLGMFVERIWPFS